MNSMLYIRGSRHDFDNWAEQGSKGWSYKDVLPYFIKSEDNYNDEYVKSGELKSPWKNRRSTCVNTILLWVIRSFVELSEILYNVC